MKKLIAYLFFILLSSIQSLNSFAQEPDCTFKEPVYKFDFGSSDNVEDVNLSAIHNYKRDAGYCPDDGFYAFASSTSQCFGNSWFTIAEDHTAGDNNGKMMLVNGSIRPGTFFYKGITGLSGNTTYEFSVWLMNICISLGRCQPMPPDISITLETLAGTKLAEFKTGRLLPKDAPQWKKYFGTFTTPGGIETVILKMNDLTNGGCGNDFAMDDITVRECRKAIVEPEAKPVEKSVLPAVVPVKKPTPVKETKPTIVPVKIKRDSSLTRVPEKDTPAVIKPVIKKIPIRVDIPKPILERANPVLKHITTAAGEIKIELYDNGEIDSDTVSIYHNNDLIISHAGLSQKPVRFVITVDPTHFHHELIMVAENLGDIPPNTSLMVITTNDNRYEVFISSSEDTNAKIVVDLKE